MKYLAASLIVPAVCWPFVFDMRPQEYVWLALAFAVGCWCVWKMRRVMTHGV